MATMERSSQELELYTIPSYSSWFSWINIHEVERFSLREFFDASTITRSPRIYKEYRDFIISKYREDPLRKLTFTEVRKSLVGDVSVLHKVFTFLEKWGLINFTIADDNERENFGGGSGKTASFGGEEEEESWKGRVKVEGGAPYGVRVVAAPNSMKPVVPLPPLPPSVVVDGGSFVGDVGDNGFKWPPLVSYSDVYGELMQQEKKKGLVCGSCEETYNSSSYEYTKDGGLILCEKCFKSGNYEKNMSADDFKLNDSVNQASVWTEAETLLLLESMVKHGDDWDLVAKNVGAKSKLDCISKLIQLPFGNFVVGAADKKNKFLDIVNDAHSKQAGLSSEESQESVKAENLSNELKDDDCQNGDAENEGPAPKRLRTELTSDYGSSLVKQVARISTVVGPHVTASAAEAAVTALCYENQCSRGIFDDYDDFVDPNTPPRTIEEERASEVDHSVEGGRNNQSEILEEESVTKSIIPLNLRTRAAAATAFGAAAADAKLLADQEERQIELLMATVLDAQLKKVHRKTKYLDDLKSIMEKEGARIQELEESLVPERLKLLQKICSAGINKTKEPSSVKYQRDTCSMKLA